MRAGRPLDAARQRAEPVEQPILDALSADELTTLRALPVRCIEAIEACRPMMRRIRSVSDEARLQEGPSGLAPTTSGWFVVNVADAAWHMHSRFGAFCGFESRDAAPFAELGINIRVLSPGQPAGLYHCESHQEGFLVLAGEALLVVDDEQRPLRAWDFVHCPPGTDHLLVGAGDGPCALLAVGARATDWSQQGLHYPVSDVAAGLDASVATSTSNPREAYADVERPEPGRPQAPGLPWHEQPGEHAR